MPHVELTTKGLKLFRDADGIHWLHLVPIAVFFDAFRKMVLLRAAKVPAQWEEAEIRQWVMDVEVPRRLIRPLTG